MHINNFYTVSQKIISFLEEEELLNSYQILSSAFQQAANTPQSNHQPSINEKLETIYDSQAIFEKIDFTKDEKLIVASLNKDKVLGDSANQSISLKISKEVGSYSAMKAVSNRFADKLRKLRDNLILLIENIEPFLNKKTISIDDEYDTITLIFKNDASVENFNDLRERVRQWKVITQLLKSAGPTEDFEIISFEDGSCKITLKNLRDGVITFGALVTFALNSYNSYLDIQIKKREIEQIKAEANITEITEINIDVQASQEIADQVARLFLNERGIKPNSDDYEEILTKITKASTYLLKFIDDGGEITFSEKAKEIESIKKIQNYFAKIDENRIIDGTKTKLIEELIDND